MAEEIVFYGIGQEQDYVKSKIPLDSLFEMIESTLQLKPYAQILK